MKKFKFIKEKLTVFCIGTFLAGIIFSGSVFATDVELEIQTTEEYENWIENYSEDSSDEFMPRTYSTEVPDSVLTEYSSYTGAHSIVSDLLGSVTSSNKLKDVSASYADSYYNIAKVLTLRVEHQGSTSECWAFSMLKAVETNVALKSGVTEIPDFSERHMDYATSKTFKDGTNSNGFNREVGGTGGLPVSALAYLTNGQGAVLEEDMPFEDNENQIYLSDIDKTVNTIVTDYISIPAIYKSYTTDSSGNTTAVKYTTSSGTAYTSTQVSAIRAIIKQAIVENGAIASLTAGNQSQYYNDSSIFSATNYNCNSTSQTRDHAITIVGWDDTYSKDNFVDGHKPSTDGAYIVLNSYGDQNFDNGYLYISYEDYFIETELYSITDTSSLDYTNLYQADFYGGIFSIGTSSTDSGYFANTYTRTTTETEYLNYVGVTVPDYVSLEIYINADGTEKTSSSLTKIGSTSVLSPGYHRIAVTSTELTSSQFTIVVKQTSENDQFYFSIETPISGTAYANVTSDGNSYYSLDCSTWINISDVSITGYSMDETDVCIKAFTSTEAEEENNGNEEENNSGEEENNSSEEENNSGEEENNSGEETITFSSNVYTISDYDVYRITDETTLDTFKGNITSNTSYSIYDGDTEVTSTSDIIKTGMIVKLSDGTEYTLVVRGDTNCDGKVTLTDLSKLILHYNETTGFILSGAAELAADMNVDGKVSLVDVSQLVVLYNEK